MRVEVEMAKCDGMVHLRRARESDARAIAEVHVRTWQQAYDRLLPDAFLKALNIEARERYWANEIAVLPPERRPWVAETQAEVVGFVSAGPSRDDDAAGATGEVYAIYVLPECWDRGVGRNLFDRAERDLIQHGYDVATLWVLDSNQRARRFYEAAGWYTDGASKVDRLGEIELSEVRYRLELQRSRVA
jgi:ribosomal protein S18 acetylase RimI-like enzyme